MKQYGKQDAILPVSAEYLLPESRDEVVRDVENFRRNGIGLIHLRLDETSLAEPDGTLRPDGAVEQFDCFIEESVRRGMPVALTLSTRWRFGASLEGFFDKRIESYDPIRAEMKRFEVYFTALFTHENRFGKKPLYEYDHLIALEPLADMTELGPSRIFWFAFLISPFIDHCFGGRVFKFYSGNVSRLSEESRGKLEHWHYRFLSFLPDPERLAIDSRLPMREADFRAGVRKAGAELFYPLATAETFSVSEDAHRDGGSEGFVTFSASGAVELKFEFPAAVSDAKFRPSLKNPVKTGIAGNTVTLCLDSPRYGVLEVNYNAPEVPAYTVYIFGDAMAADPAGLAEYRGKIKSVAPGFHRQSELKAEGAQLLYFAPGVHRVEDDKLLLESGCDVFLARGAVLKAGIAADRVENVRIFGNGIIDATSNLRLPGENWRSLGEEGCLFFLHGKNVVIDGPVLYNPQFWAVVVAGTQFMTIRNFKVLAWIVNDDGIQPRSVNDFTVEHCFIKTMDDCVAVKTRKAIGMESRRLRFRDLVLWQDVAQGLEIGHTSQADILEDVRFEEIELVHGGYNSLSMHVMDHETVRNVVYDHIYFEGKPSERCIEFAINGDPTPYRSDDDCGQIMDVTVRNLFFEHEPYPARITGYDANHIIRNVKLENIQYALADGNPGKKVERMEQLNIETRFSGEIKLVD